MTLNLIVRNGYNAKKVDANPQNPYPPTTDEYLAFETGVKGFVAVATRVDGQEYGIQWDFSDYQSIVPENLAADGEGYIHSSFSDALAYLRGLLAKDTKLRNGVSDVAAPLAVPFNELSVIAAEKALAAHAEALNGIEGNASVQVWHLLASLQEFCAVKGVDLDAELRELREGISRGELNLPASEESLKKKS